MTGHWRRSSKQRRWTAADAVRTAVAVLLCTLCFAGVLRRQVLATRLAPGELEFGAFEELDGHLVFATLPWHRENQLVTIDFYDHGRELGLPPGWSAALPLQEGVRLRIAPVSGFDPLPRVALGVDQPLPAGSTYAGQLFPVPSGAAVLSDAETPHFAADHLTLKPWNPDVPWRAEMDDLRELTRRCEVSVPAALEVVRQGGHVTLMLGRCSITRALPVKNGRLAIMAGLDAVSITRESPWPYTVVRNERAPLALLVSLLLGMLLVAGIGAGPAALTASLTAFASALLPFEALAAVFLSLPLLCLAALVRFWTGAGGFGRAALLSVLALVGLQAHRARSDPDWGQRRELPSQAPACTALGYSTMAGSGLRFGTMAVRDDLRESCRACGGDTALIASGGQTLDFIARESCLFAARGAHPGSQWLFLGGSNDDILWALVSPSFAGVQATLSMGRAVLFDADWIDKADHFSRSATWSRAGPKGSLAQLDQQLGALQHTLSCVSHAGGTFRWYQDYFITDLRDGRSPERTQMVAARAKVLQGAGAEFVDLLELTREEASLSWFNDQIHLSTRAHRRMAELMCGAISR